MTRIAKIKAIKEILESTNFDVRQRGGKYIFERTKIDDKFIPDVQIVSGYENALLWAFSVRNQYYK